MLASTSDRLDISLSSEGPRHARASLPQTGLLSEQQRGAGSMQCLQHCHALDAAAQQAYSLTFPVGTGRNNYAHAISLLVWALARR